MHRHRMKQVLTLAILTLGACLLALGAAPQPKKYTLTGVVQFQNACRSSELGAPHVRAHGALADGETGGISVPASVVVRANGTFTLTATWRADSPPTLWRDFNVVTTDGSDICWGRGKCARGRGCVDRGRKIGSITLKDAAALKLQNHPSYIIDVRCECRSVR